MIQEGWAEPRQDGVFVQFYMYVYLVYLSLFGAIWRRKMDVAHQNVWHLDRGTAMIAGGAGIASGSRGATWQWLASLGAATSAVGSIGSAPGDVLMEFSIIELDDGKILTGKPNQFDGKNPWVSG